MEKSEKFEEELTFGASNVFYGFWCSFTNMPSNTFPPPSTTSNTGGLFFHGDHKASSGAWGVIYGDRKISRTYVVDAVVRGRFRVCAVEVSQPKILNSRDRDVILLRF